MRRTKLRDRQFKGASILCTNKEIYIYTSATTYFPETCSVDIYTTREGERVVAAMFWSDNVIAITVCPCLVMSHRCCRHVPTRLERGTLGTAEPVSCFVRHVVTKNETCHDTAIPSREHDRESRERGSDRILAV